MKYQDLISSDKNLLSTMWTYHGCHDYFSPGVVKDENPNEGGDFLSGLPYYMKMSIYNYSIYNRK